MAPNATMRMLALSVLHALADHWVLEHARPGLPGIQEKVDLNTSVDAVKRKMIDAAGAGKSFTSPGWLTQLGRLWGGKSVRYYPCLLHRIAQMQLALLTEHMTTNVELLPPNHMLLSHAKLGRGQHCHHPFLVLQDTPVADAKPDDIKDLLGGALFKALFKWMQESGPVYLLPTGELLSTGSTCWLLAAQHGQCARGYNQLATFSGMFDMSNIHMHIVAAVRATCGLQHPMHTTLAGIS